MKAAPRELKDTALWKRTDVWVKTLYVEMRPRRGDRALEWPAGFSAVEIFRDAAAAHNFELTMQDAETMLDAFVSLGFVESVAPKDGADGALLIPSFPPAVYAARAKRDIEREEERRARYAAQKGPKGGAGGAERQNKKRHTPSVEPSREDESEAKSARDGADVTGTPVTGTQESRRVEPGEIRDVSPPPTRAPAPTPAPPPPPLGGGGGRSGGGGEGQQPGAERRTNGERRGAPSAPPSGPKTPRTPSDLARLTPLEVGTWASEILAPSMQVFTAGGVADRKCLGQLIVEMGLGEDDMRLLAEHWRRQPVPAIRVVQSVIGPLMTRLPAGNIDRKVLTATLAAARDWQRTTMPGPARTGAPPPVDKITGTS